MGEHAHHFESWPFADPVNTLGFTTVHVQSGARPILIVTHDEDDGAWQFLCGTTNAEEDGRMLCLGCTLEHDEMLGELADLPLGWVALRRGPGAPWQRMTRVDWLS